MTDQLTALRELVAKVEAGKLCTISNEDLHAAHLEDFVWVFDDIAEIKSLDAAKALHEALLPGWGWFFEAGNTDRMCAGVFIEESGKPPFIGAAPNNPARAWLIADLKALIAKLEATQ